eukprot:8701961-Pyramimonas_sp.AAC.1
MACREEAYPWIRGQWCAGRGHIPGSGANGVQGGGIYLATAPMAAMRQKSEAVLSAAGMNIFAKVHSLARVTSSKAHDHPDHFSFRSFSFHVRPQTTKQTLRLKDLALGAPDQ